jgi:[ribosomal protein S5]-alanine N-acetyltransferase
VSTWQTGPMTATRLVTLADVPGLAGLYRENREFLAPWEPRRGEEFYTEAGQRAMIERQLAKYQRGEVVPRVILDDAGAVAGRVNLNDIVRGAFESCTLGYWVSESANGHGLATRAVAEIAELAFGPVGLHRIQAGTLPHNIGSQRVLERNGFTRIGLAPAYLHIAGRWQDHVLYQLLAPGES